MNNEKNIADKELKETIDKLLSDSDVLLQIISKLQDVRYQYLTDESINIETIVDDMHILEDKFQMIEIFG